MNRYLGYILFFTSIFSQDEKLAVSILDFKGEDMKPKELKACFQRLETSLIESGQFIVIEKSEREEILKEQEVQSSGVCDEECVVEIGQLLGAEYLMLGEIIDFTGLYQIDIKIVNVEKGDVIEKVTKEVEGGIKDLLNAMERASDEIIRKISVFKPNSQFLAGQFDDAVENEYGYLSIYSDPSDAIVLIDDNKIGSTPIENKRIQTGTRNLKIIKKGYVTINKGIKIKEDKNTKVDEMLVLKTGSVNIIAMPKKSKIYIDNKYIGFSPVKIPNLTVGQHQIKASHEDYLTGIESVLVEYEKTKDIRMDLSPKMGVVNIILGVSDVNIWINDDKYKSDQSGFTEISLSPGDYEIELKKVGYKTEKKMIKIFPNKSETIEIEMYIKEKNEIDFNSNQSSNPYSYLDPNWANTKSKIDNMSSEDLDIAKEFAKRENIAKKYRTGLNTDKKGLHYSGLPYEEWKKIESSGGLNNLDEKSKKKINSYNKNYNKSYKNSEKLKKEASLSFDKKIENQIFKKRHPISASVSWLLVNVVGGSQGLETEFSDQGNGYCCMHYIYWIYFIAFLIEYPELYENIL